MANRDLSIFTCISAGLFLILLLTLRGSVFALVRSESIKNGAIEGVRSRMLTIDNLDHMKGDGAEHYLTAYANEWAQVVFTFKPASDQVV